MNTEMIVARDGTKIACFRYPVEGQPSCRLIFLHGSTFNSRRYANLAKACAKVGCEVVLVDWRGHGQSEGQPGHCDYPGQLEDDVADIISHYKPDSLPTIIGGHSAGSIVCLKYIERYGQDDISGCYFISPAMSNILEASKFDLRTSKRQFFLNFWRKKPTYNPVPEKALQYIPQFKNKKFWLAIMFPFLRSKKVLFFPGSEKMAKLEGRVMEYSTNMVLSVSLTNYIQAFRLINKPVLLICGGNDEMIDANFLHTVANWHLPPELDKSVEIAPKLNHTNIINGACKILPQWLATRWPATVTTQNKTHEDKSQQQPKLKNDNQSATADLQLAEAQ